MKTKISVLGFLILLTLFAGIYQAAAQGTTAFTYQGQLRDAGTNANGTYTMVFKLYDAVTSGNQIGSTITTNQTLANGLFTVNLDFGNAFNGSARWLDITVQAGNDSEELTPRVQVMPAPYAQFAAVAATVTNGAITATQIANGAVVNASLSSNAVNAIDISPGQVVKSLNGLADNVRLSAGNNFAILTNGNMLQLSASVPNIQAFYADGTFVVPTNVTRITVEAWGAGGSGGNGYDDGTNAVGGGGGGGGAYALNSFNVTPGVSFPITVGTGGTIANAAGASSLGNLIIAGGGNAGGSATSANGLSAGTGGHGGKSTGSVFPSIGGPGQTGYINLSAIGGGGGNGGNAVRGGDGGWGNSDQIDGQGPGGGGGGGAHNGQGGNGANGAVIVYY